MEQAMNWFEAAERLGITAILLLILFWIARHWIEPVIKSQLKLFIKMEEAIDANEESLASNEKTQKKQTELLEQIVQHEHLESESLKRIEDKLDNLHGRQKD